MCCFRMHQANNLSTILNRKEINQYPIANRNEDFKYYCGLQIPKKRQSICS